MKKIFSYTEGLTRRPTHYCPGCTHGVIHRLVGEVVEELGLRGRTVGIAPVGCSVLAYEYFNCDMFEASHGRAPAVATGAKRTRPNLIVFTYQGDGDLASIGMAEIVHAANRGEKFTTIFVNNAIYGMTGGQMAPTTMPGQHSTTSPGGRNCDEAGYPIRVAELLSTLTTPAYIERVAVHTPAHTIRAKEAIRKAFELQAEGRCYTFIEVLSTCPTNWGLSPRESEKWLENVMMPYYTLGVKKRPEDFDGGIFHGKH
ncbi:MAG: thiamine pyrophosphate-dependent enzyme [Deltaproteobacteria bacterium]|nr:thiamine pyrophosphate-dependent enzyme [Deltaproteobacteria bacterium]